MFRMQLRNLLQASLLLLKQTQDDAQTINDLRNLCDELEEAFNSASNGEKVRTLHEKAQKLATKISQQSEAQAEKMSKLQTERDELSKKMEQLEAQMEAEEKLNRMLYKFAQKQIATFFGWLHTEGFTNITIEQLKEFLARNSASDVVHLMMETDLVGLIESIQSITFLTPGPETEEETPKDDKTD